MRVCSVDHGESGRFLFERTKTAYTVMVEIGKETLNLPLVNKKRKMKNVSLVIR